MFNPNQVIHHEKKNKNMILVLNKFFLNLNLEKHEQELLRMAQQNPFRSSTYYC